MTTAEVCFWCGDSPTHSRDHVFPGCLFPDPMPEGVTPITVPACEAHNGRFSLDEEYFRDFILGGSYGHPQAKAIWDQKTTRALQRSPKYRAMLARDVYDADYRTASGIHLGKVTVLVAKADRIRLIFRKIITGLYFDEYSANLGFPAMNVYQLMKPSDLDPVRHVLGAMPIRRLGHIAYRFGRAIDEERAVLGIFFFFDHPGFMVITDAREPDLDDPLSAMKSAKPRSPLWTPKTDSRGSSS